MSPINHLASRAAATFSRLAARSDPSCINAEGGDMCALPVAGTHVTEIVIGSVIGVLAVIVIGILTYFHLRRQRLDLKEWTGKNNQELDDYGISNGSESTKPKSTYQAEVAHAKSEQASAAASPIPAPAPVARRSSQDSLRSLEMSLRQQHKPADMV